MPGRLVALAYARSSHERLIAGCWTEKTDVSTQPRNFDTVSITRDRGDREGNRPRNGPQSAAASTHTVPYKVRKPPDEAQQGRGGPCVRT